MPQLPVAGYALQISTAPPPQSGAPPAPFRVGVSIQLQAAGPYQPLPINGPEEFLAVVALLQAPGRLFYDPAGATLEKLEP